MGIHTTQYAHDVLQSQQCLAKQNNNVFIMRMMTNLYNCMEQVELSCLASQLHETLSFTVLRDEQSKLKHFPILAIQEIQLTQYTVGSHLSEHTRTKGSDILNVQINETINTICMQAVLRSLVISLVKTLTLTIPCPDIEVL